MSQMDESQVDEPRRSPDVPPHDLSAEQAVLGSILKNPRAIHQVIDQLVADAFYDTRHRLIYGAMVTLARQDTPIEYHTLLAELERQGTLQRVGGADFVYRINIGTPTAAFIEYYAQIIADHFVRQRAISIAQTTTEVAWRAQLPVDEMLATAQAAILGLSDQAGARVRSTTAEASIEHWLEEFGTERPLNEKGDRIVGHSTGLRSLDKITLGLQPARLYLLPAYTSVGKSQLAHQVALHVARHHGPVLLVSLEMSDQELTGRALAMETGIPLEALATHAINEAEAARVLEAAERQQSDPLHYMDGADGLTTSQIRSRAMQLQAQHGRLALIVADYGQLLTDSKGNNSSVEDQTLVSRNLKRLARALDVPLLVPVQINRQAGDRRDSRPRLSDIRESGSWEQDADVVIGLYRDELVHPDTDDRGMLELIVLKNRHSGQRPPFTAKAVWHGGRYWEWDRNSYAGRDVAQNGVVVTDRNGHMPSRLPYADT
jgi:replicative DNA helicase